MNIGIASMCLQDYAPLGEITYPLWQRYCERHGYRLMVATQPLSHRGPSWDKIIMLRELLPQFDLLLWVGCDTLVTNPEIKVEDVYAPYEPSSLLIAADVFGLNTDVMLFKNYHPAQMLLYAVHEHGYPAYREHPWAEQEAIIRFCGAEPYRSHVTVVPQKGFNSQLHKEYSRPEEWPGNWSEGDWILHLAGLEMGRRLELARRFLAI